MYPYTTHFAYSITHYVNHITLSLKQASGPKGSAQFSKLLQLNNFCFNSHNVLCHGTYSSAVYFSHNPCKLRDSSNNPSALPAHMQGGYFESKAPTSSSKLSLALFSPRGAEPEINTAHRKVAKGCPENCSLRGTRERQNASIAPWERESNDAAKGYSNCSSWIRSRFFSSS